MSEAKPKRGAPPHHYVDDAWLALRTEEVIEPARPIVDPHHHLWDNRSYAVAGADAHPFMTAIAETRVLPETLGTSWRKLRAAWPNTFVINTGFGVGDDRDEFERVVADGVADVVTVGRPFIGNPDLVTRWTQGAELTEPDPESFYGGGAEGYTDYPALSA